MARNNRKRPVGGYEHERDNLLVKMGMYNLEEPSPLGTTFMRLSASAQAYYRRIEDEGFIRLVGPGQIICVNPEYLVLTDKGKSHALMLIEEWKRSLGCDPVAFT